MTTTAHEKATEHIAAYGISRDGQRYIGPGNTGSRISYDCIEQLDEAISIAQKLLEGHPQDKPVTYTVSNEDDYLLAAVTNRRIVGRFVKQEWDQRNNAITLGEEDFDATDFILSMSPDSLRALEDDRESSDAVGQAHVSWEGPCSVTIKNAVCDYFGVDDIKDISDEALAFVRRAQSPAPATSQSATLSLQVQLRVAAGATVDQFLEQVSCTARSNTPGVVVVSTQVARGA